MIFNPLRPHLVSFKNGKYGIRRLTVHGWAYLSTNNFVWWNWDHQEYVKEECQSYHIATVREALQKLFAKTDYGHYIRFGARP